MRLIFQAPTVQYLQWETYLSSSQNIRVLWSRSSNYCPCAKFSLLLGLLIGAPPCTLMYIWTVVALHYNGREVVMSVQPTKPKYLLPGHLQKRFADASEQWFSTLDTYWNHLRNIWENSTSRDFDLVGLAIGSVTAPQVALPGSWDWESGSVFAFMLLLPADYANVHLGLRTSHLGQ